MIAKLTGRIDSLGDDWVVIDVGGVGYLVFCPSRTLGRLPPVGETVTLFIETHVREDHIHLFGFASAAEREWFRVLCTVQGVGSKVGLAILGVVPADDLVHVIAAQDKAALTRASGVGPKLATRILTELKDKAGGIAIGAAAAGGVRLPDQAEAPVGGGAVGDAVSALVNLGYGRSEALAVVSKVSRAEGGPTDVGGLIRAALAALGPKEH